MASKRITDKARLDWLIECGFIKWLGIDGSIYGARRAIDAAMLCVDKMRERGWFFSFIFDGVWTAIATRARETGAPMFYSRDSFLPRAVGKACLMAVGV